MKSTFEIKIQEAQKVNLNNGIPVYCINAGTQDIVRLEIFRRRNYSSEQTFSGFSHQSYVDGRDYQ